MIIEKYHVIMADLKKIVLSLLNPKTEDDKELVRILKEQY